MGDAQTEKEHRPLGTEDREASLHALLRVLVAEVWLQILALPPDQVEAIPAPVMNMLSTIFFSGALGLLPHENAIEDARSRADWAEAIQSSQKLVLDRLAAVADPLHAAVGARPIYRYNRSGVSVRDFSIDMDRIEAALIAPSILPTPSPFPTTNREG